ncbi:DEAD/DEAH box helicase [Hugenholtzia roseola]|uniref:DEAD/DEAH box helicase n=1 Tax=Hugenholtzia roseola TaxID=1002 RepID=UPI00041E1B34|nr:AAA domain-containing protein [Hugenholtzia roseola]
MLVRLNEIESRYFYDLLFNIVTDPNDPPLKKRLYAVHNVFLSLLNTLTEDRQKQLFTGWHAKINFICQAYGLGESWEEELQALRRTLRGNVLSKFYHPTPAVYKACVAGVVKLLQVFTTVSPNEEILALYQGEELPSLIRRKKPEGIVPFLFGTVVAKEEYGKSTPTEGETQSKPTAHFWLSTEEFGKVRIAVSDITIYFQGKLHHHYRLSEEVRRLSLYVPICLTDVEPMDDTYFATTDSSLLVLNPDYLVDASIIAKCFTYKSGTPFLYLQSRLQFFEGNDKTLKGKIVNDLLDKIIDNPTVSFEKSFGEALKDNALDAAFIEKELLLEIRDQAKYQFGILLRAMQNYQDNILTTEPTFISNQYGLQGRIDVLIEHKEQPQRKDILELKSGKPPQETGWKNDLIQVACYNLLLDSTFADRRGISALLYSADAQTPLRDCGKLNFEQQRAMEMRNKIVAMDTWLAQADEKVFDHFLKRIEDAKPFQNVIDQAKKFQDLWDTASPLDRAYFIEFVGLVMREAMVAKVGGVIGTEPAEGFATLWKNTKMQKNDNFVLLSDLYLLEWDSEENLLHLQRNQQNGEITAFRKGDIVVIYPTEADGELQPLKYQILKGNIEEISAQKVKVRLWSRHVSEGFFRSYSHWAIEPNLLERSFNDLLASLATFLAADKSKKDLIYGKTRPTFATPPTLAAIDYSQIANLGEEQNQILKQALSAKDYFLLQGPPGTGKTSKMLRNMVYHLYHYTNENVVLLAFTNRATDEICQKVEQVCGADFVRLGNFKEGDDFYTNSLKSAKNLQELKLKIRDTRIFVSTVSSFYSNLRLLDFKKFQTLIVDEASQLLEPHLCGIMSRFERFILIGDEKQLPAVVAQPEKLCATEKEPLHQIGIHNLGRSVFERLIENAENKGWTEAYAMLSTQFRTHQDIAEFICTTFYKTLKAGSPRQFEPLPHLEKPLTLLQDSIEVSEKEKTFYQKIQEKLVTKRLLLIDVPTERNMKFHQKEAEIVVKILNLIRKKYENTPHFQAETVGVITPYRAQIAEIYKHLDEELRQKVSIDTVERYQGSERDIIILSMATNYPAQMRFLQAFNQSQTVDKKLNVALSRCREQLILIGNLDLLKQGKFYQAFLEWAAQRVEILKF